jgi:hypothetical protein
MNDTGAFWSLNGAEAVLRLRALRSSGDFDDYWGFHEIREYERNHENLYAYQQIPIVKHPNQSLLYRSKTKLKIVK